MPGQDREDRRDLTLLARVADGDRDAFRELVAHHQAAVFRLARMLTSDRPTAEDVLQETFVAALRGAAGFRCESSPRTWLLTIARNKAHRTRRRQSPDPVDDAELDRLGAEAGWGAPPDPERLALRSERRGRLALAFERLAPDDREVLLLRDLEGLSGEETALAMGLGVPAMKSRLHRARLRFAAALRQVGEEGDDGA